jgi:hypothetical protein
MKPAPFYTILILLLVLVVSSCVKDPEPTGGDGNGGNDTTTSVRFTAYKDSTILPGVFIGITPNLADRDNGIYLFTATTNSAGSAEFKDLQAITYWYSASYAAPGGAIVRNASITFEKGDQVRRDLNF